MEILKWIGAVLGAIILGGILIGGSAALLALAGIVGTLVFIGLGIAILASIIKECMDSD